MSDRPELPPLRILVVADFGSPEPVGPFPVTRASLADLFERFAPRVELHVKDHLGLTEPGRDLEIAFRRIEDFDPPALVQALPALAATATLHGQLSALTSDAEVRERLDPLLAPVEKIGLKRALIGIAKSDLEAVASGVKALGKVLGVQLEEILHHPRFQEVEAAWRGLALLVPEAPAPDCLRIDAMSMTRDDLPGPLSGILADQEEEPASVVLLDFDFDHTGPSLDRLRELASTAAEQSAILIAGAGPQLFGLDTLLHLSALPELDALFSGEGYAAFNEFRSSNAARNAALVANRFLLRPLHDRHGLDFDYSEKADSVRRDQYLWGRAVWPAGANLVRSFVETGHCTALSGVEGEGVVAGLPTRAFGGEEAVTTAVDVVLGQANSAQFARLGLSLLIDGDAPGSAYFPLLSVCHRSGEKPISPEIAVEYRLMAERAALHFSRSLAALGDGLDPQELPGKLREAFQGFLGPDAGGEGVSAELQKEDGKDEVLRLVLRPGRKIIGKDVEIRLTASL